MGNKPVIKPAEKVSLVMEQFIRLLHECGMPMDDVDLLNCEGPVAEELIVGTGSTGTSTGTGTGTGSSSSSSSSSTGSPIRLTQFTGSSRVANHLSTVTAGKVKIEDAGFDWKILGPDVNVNVNDTGSGSGSDTGSDNNVDYVAWQCDQDAYASQGQKCSAQSILFVHENWKKAGLLEKLKARASMRSLDDLTIGPIMTHTTNDIMEHIAMLLDIPGSSILFGGKELTNHHIPSMYGAVEPTAVYVPLKEMLKDDDNFEKSTTEIFAPFQVITTYGDDEIDLVLEACERMHHHLTAAIVSNDVKFLNKVIANTVNGTTYAGMRARTTGAPQNHWFGPAGDCRGAGIGTPESVQMVWSCHREVIHDTIIPEDWKVPAKPS